MENYKWESPLHYNILSLRIMGLWPKGDGSYTLGPYIVCTFLLYTTFILCHVFFQAVNLYFLRDDLEAFVGTSYILLIKVLSAFKAYYLMKNMGLVKQVLRTLNGELFQPRNQVQRDMVDSNLKLWTILKRSFIVSCYFSNAFFGIYPLFDRTSVERRLPFLAWYPFDVKHSPSYELTYVYQMVAVVYNTTVHINVDSLMCTLNVYAGSQFDMLSDNLRHLVEEASNDVGEKLVRCIQHHKQILEYVKNCIIIFNWIVFFQFFISAFCIGITMFQLTLVIPFSNQFTSLLCYISAIILQIFLFSFFGNEIEHKSSRVLYAVFESDWTGLPLKIKKICIIFTIKLLQPVRVSALDLFYLNLDTFVRILRTSWSYFAFLHQMGSREN